jgi:hypothetical protein
MSLVFTTYTTDQALGETEVSKWLKIEFDAEIEDFANHSRRRIRDNRKRGLFDDKEISHRRKRIRTRPDFSS